MLTTVAAPPVRGAAPLCTPATPCVDVHVVGQAQQPRDVDVTSAQIAAHGGTAQNNACSNGAWSVADLVGSVIGPGTRATFTQAILAGHDDTLDAADLYAPDFPSGDVAAVCLTDVQPGEAKIEYNRPPTAGDPAQDLQTGSADSTLMLTVHLTGRLLHPQLAVRPAEPAAGAKVRLSETALAPDPANTYIWTFGDAPAVTTSTRTTTHRYLAGTWYSSVVVTEPDTSWGQSDRVAVPVGPPTKQPGPGRGRHKRGPKAGPAGGAGHRSGTPKRAATSGPTRPVAPAPVPAAGAAATSGSSGTGSTAGHQPPAPAAGGSGSRPAPTAAQAQLVAGLVLADPGAPQPSAAPAVPAAAADAAGGQRPFRVPAAVWWVLALAALAGIGAAAERRRPPGPERMHR